MPSKMRLQKIADRIRQEISEMLIRDVSDPRLEGIFITDVSIDRELAFADVYVSAIEGASRSAEIIAGLQHAAGFFRSALAAKVDLRTFPRLRFHWDPTPENADRIEKILASLREETARQEDTKKDE